MASKKNLTADDVMGALSNASGSTKNIHRMMVNWEENWPNHDQWELVHQAAGALLGFQETLSLVTPGLVGENAWRLTKGSGAQ